MFPIECHNIEREEGLRKNNCEEQSSLISIVRLQMRIMI